VGVVGRDKQPPQASEWVGCNQTLEDHRVAEQHGAGVRRTGDLQMRSPIGVGRLVPSNPPTPTA
jgi:hypothetical protein